jgi:hypothetical protein
MHTAGDFLSIPLYAFVAFAAICTLICAFHRDRKETWKDQAAQVAAGFFVTWVALILARLVQLIP